MSKAYAVVTTGIGICEGNQYGIASAVFCRGAYWATQPIMPGSTDLWIYKIHATKGTLVAKLKVTNTLSASNLTTTTDGNRVYVTGGGAVSTRCVTVDPGSFPDPSSITLSNIVAPLGYGWAPRSVVTPDGYSWINYNSVRCFNTQPYPDMSSMITVAGTAGSGSSITYDPVNDYVFASGGTGNPTKIWRIDRASKTIIDFITVNSTNDVIYAFGSLWASNSTQLRRYNPKTLALELNLATSTFSLGADKRYIMIGDTVSNQKYSILDPLTNTIVQPGSLGGSYLQPWASNSVNCNAIQTNPATHGFLAPTSGRSGGPLYGWAFMDSPLSPGKLRLGSNATKRFRK